ncbi:dihydrofolate reductase [Pedobacter psychrotolerans]|uniref:Dihydrofolate reductase n=1 Tax=Pedobacter psychrotolerans TaxID=1843235 RepID=A0A4R2H4X5_9SPHI|nr:dihydrofolate reductase [Pedobacter psychrotolerans]TCO20731.1 dihydrofolate reductase [Pedobacter psychrotolerans]GGE67657.1 dihydrofolate reductase [Pedobacter psychrotolerans]
MTNEQKSPSLSIAVATGENREIGKNNQLLWHMPADLKFFKQTTSGHTIIMGRKTFDSVGRPLPNRRNIVITRDASLQIEGVEVVNSFEQALEITNTEEKPIFIVGGAEIYRQALPETDTLYLTTIHHQFDADTFFPEFDRSEWEVVSSEHHQADEKNKYDYTFEVLKRI